MATEVLLPKQGNSVESCIILEWKKAVGDTVTAGEPILEVETDKATFEVESTADGVLLSRLVVEGDDVPVLAPVALVGEPGEVPEPEPSGGVETAPTQPESKPSVAAPESRQLAAGTSMPSRKAGGRIAISPRARKLADKHGVSHAQLTGSGPNGRIMVRDVEAGIASGLTAGAGQPEGATVATGAATASGGYEEIAVTGIRKIISQRMLESLTTTAQFTMNTSADARRLLDYRAHLKVSERDDLRSISINDLVMFAVSRVLRSFPEMNATYSDGVVRRYESVNLGFAVDTDRGLMVPVVGGAEKLTLTQLAARAHELAESCKTMKATPEDLSGGTFSVTNLGIFGIESFTPVLDAPQVGILGVGAIAPKPVVTAGETSYVPSIGLSLTINHQIVDGAPGARFLQNLAQAIAEIDLTLAQ